MSQLKNTAQQQHDGATDAAAASSVGAVADAADVFARDIAWFDQRCLATPAAGGSAVAVARGDES